jgi:hypothetical protein
MVLEIAVSLICKNPEYGLAPSQPVPRQQWNQSGVARKIAVTPEFSTPESGALSYSQERTGLGDSVALLWGQAEAASYKDSAS